MTDIEYGTDFAVYLTSDGVRYLTNKVSLKIMDLLAVSGMTVTELADALEHQKTSIQSNLKKLEGMSLVTSFVDNNDRRRTIYVSRASEFLIPAKNTGKLDEYILSVLHTISHALQKGALDVVSIRRGIYFATVIAGLNVGVGISPLFGRCGTILADRSREYIEGKTFSEVLDYIRDSLTRAQIDGVDIEIQEDGIQLNIKPDEILKQYSSIISKFVVGYVSTIISIHKGERYCMKSRSVDEGYTEHIIISSYGYVPPEHMILGVVEDSAVSRVLSIFSVNGKAVIFGNPTQIRILEELSYSGLSLKGLSVALDLNTVTVHTNLEKLREIGAIDVSDPKATRATYVLKAFPAIIGCDPEFGAQEIINNVATKSAEDPSMFYWAIFKYISYAFRRAGFDASELVRNIGKTSSSLILSNHRDFSAMDYIQYICTFKLDLGAVLKMRSPIPLVFEMSGESVKEDFKFLRSFYEGLLMSGLYEITNEDYKISFVIADQ